MKKKQTIFSAILLVVAAGGWYAYSEFTRKVKDLSYVKAGVFLNAPDLVAAFQNDEVKANAIYLDKIIDVKGKIRTIEKNDNGYYSVILGEETSMSSVRCSMDSVHQQDVAGFKPGSIVTIKGACTGFTADELLGADVILNRCVVEK